MQAQTDSTQIVEAYRRDLRRHPVLPADAQIALARRARAGDAKALARLVESNLRLAVRVAGEHWRPGQSRMDLVQQANLGLLAAVERFDPDRGFRFSTYAAWWMRAYVRRWQIRGARLVRFGTTASERRLFYSLAKTRSRLEARGVRATPDAMGEALGVDARLVEEAEGRLTQAEVREGLDDLPDGAASTDDRIESAEKHLRLRASLDAFAAELSPRERTILERRLLAEEPLTLAALGRSFGTTRERARQLEKRVVERLRAHVLDDERLGADCAA
jgi:RNA polymerase sigma-32 factor